MVGWGRRWGASKSWCEGLSRNLLSFLRGVTPVSTLLKSGSQRILQTYQHIDAGMQCEHTDAAGNRCTEVVPAAKGATGKRHRQEHGFVRQGGVLRCPEHHQESKRGKSHAKKEKKK